MIVLPRYVPHIIIVLLGLLFFSQLLLTPGSLLYSNHSDFISYHVPYHKFLVQTWQQTGELPLWCPEIFAGMPGIQDPQVCAFYPLHLPLYWVSVDQQGAALSYLIVLHVIIAGLFMYAYARHQQLSSPAAFVSAMGYMFAGKWMAHLLIAGHHNLAPLAWLPLILLLMEVAIAKRTLLHATAAGGLFALIILGTHPQITIYCGMFIALWTYGTSRLLATKDVGTTTSQSVFLPWLLTGIWTAVVGGLLSAVQLWPALEAIGHSSRSLGVSIGVLSLIGSLLTMLGFIGPAITNDATWFWEDRVCVGLIWLAIAISTRVFNPNTRNRTWLWYGFIWLAIGMISLAMLQWLPGFHIWRLQSRTMFFLAIPLSLLIGSATQTLFVDQPLSQNRRSDFAAMIIRFAIILILPLCAYSLMEFRKGTAFRFSAYWPWLIIALPVVWWVIQRPFSKLMYWMWCLVLLGDLWAIALPWTSVIPETKIYERSQCIDYLKSRVNEHGRVMSISPKPYQLIPSSQTPLWPNLGMIAGIETVGGYNPLDVLRYKQFLSYIEDRTEPLRAVNGLTQPIPTCIMVNNSSLSDMLGARFLLMPSDISLEEVIEEKDARSHWVPVFKDEHPHAYFFVTHFKEEDTGIISMPAYTVYENRQALPRAFVVHEAQTLPKDENPLAALKTTDFRRRVLIEGEVKQQSVVPAGGKPESTANIRVYQPNRVSIDVQSSQPGWLVLTDVWFPGWTCTVDGEAAEVSRANYAFRAVPIPQGKHSVEFRMVSKKYQYGKWISSIAFVMFIGSVSLLSLRRRKE